MNSTFEAFAKEMAHNQKQLLAVLIPIAGYAAVKGIKDATKKESDVVRPMLIGAGAMGLGSAALLALSAIAHKQMPPATAFALPPTLAAVGAGLAGSAYGLSNIVKKRFPNATPE